MLAYCYVPWVTSDIWTTQLMVLKNCSFYIQLDPTLIPSVQHLMCVDVYSAHPHLHATTSSILGGRS